jgi:hypothetical protein
MKLTDLCHDLLLVIFNKLDFRSKINFIKVCKKFRNTVPYSYTSDLNLIKTTIRTYNYKICALKIISNLIFYGFVLSSTSMIYTNRITKIQFLTSTIATPLFVFVLPRLQNKSYIAIYARKIYITKILKN